MNYLDLLHKLWEYNQNEPLGATPIAMYLFLLETWNKNNGADFKVSDILICEKLLLTRPTVKATKEKLRNCGLIYYETQNGLPSYYRMILDYTSLRKGEKPGKDVAERNQKPVATIEKPKIDPPVELPVEKPEIVIFPSQKLAGPMIITDNKSIPPIAEVFDFAKTLPIYNSSLYPRLQKRYEEWVNNGWHTHQNKPITNWKPLVRATLAHMVKPPESGTLSLDQIPSIKPPKAKSTYDE